MADFTAVLRKTIGALKDNTPETRAQVYDKARATIEAKLAAASPSPELVERQRKLIEDAINEVEAEYAAAEDTTDESPDTTAPAEAPRPAARAREARAAEPVRGPEEDEGWSEDQHPSEGPRGPEYDFTPEPAVAHYGESGLYDDGAERRRGFGGLVAVLLILLVFGAAAFGAWVFRDDLAQVAGYENFNAAMTGNAAPTVDEAAPEADPVARDAKLGELTAGGEPESEASQEKFTQRLTPDGREIDEGPAADEPERGEGTSIAQSTQEDGGSAGTSGGEPDQPGQSQSALPVGQQAIFYEERTSASQGSAENGAVVWSTVEESPGNNLPPEPAVRAEATIPEKSLQLKMTVRRNVDESLPASHIIELIFLTPDDFEGGGIENVLRVAMKGSEQETGSPLLGIPVKIADGFFLVALNDSPADLETNRLLMRRQSWIDIPIVYKSGRRALITLEKGVPGNQIFQDALDAWDNASSG